MKNVIIAILTLTVLASCSPAFKLRKAERLIKQAEALGAKVQVDTVYVTKIIEGKTTTINVPVDRLIHSTDTFTVYQDKIKLHYRTVHDTLRLTVECPPDTIRVPITVHKSIICPDCPKDKLWKGIGIGAGGILILLILLALARAIRG
jgi:hypothetical protein